MEVHGFDTVWSNVFYVITGCVALRLNERVAARYLFAVAFWSTLFHGYACFGSSVIVWRALNCTDWITAGSGLCYSGFFIFTRFRKFWTRLRLFGLLLLSLVHFAYHNWCGGHDLYLAEHWKFHMSTGLSILVIIVVHHWARIVGVAICWLSKTLAAD